MEHLALEIFDLDGKGGSQYAYLSEDTSINITDTSEVFASGNVWSHAFTLNVNANPKIFGTSGDIHGSRLHEQLNGRRARIWVDGLPLYLGYLRLDDEVDVSEDGDVDVTFESGQKTFDELIRDGKANQVPMMDDVMIGMALWRKRWSCAMVELQARVVFKEYEGWNKKKYNYTATGYVTHDANPVIPGYETPWLTYFTSDGEQDNTSVQEYPRMVFPKGTFYNMATGKEETIDCLNTDTPYDDNHPYCNIALCYQKYGYTITTEENGVRRTHDDYSAEPTAQRGYEVMPANRVNSAPNFYVIYWLRALMKHLGIYIEENQMMDMEDLRRLFFVNTNCVYDEPKYLRDSKYDGYYGTYQFGSAGPLLAEYFGDLVQEAPNSSIKRWTGCKKISKPENCTIKCESFDGGDNPDLQKYGGIDRVEIKAKSVFGMSEALRVYYDGYDAKRGYGTNRLIQRNHLLHKAIASSECFPNVDISEVIKALENGFGVRLLFDNSYKRVRIVLLKNIFQDTTVQHIKCDVLSEVKTENSIRGFKMTYSGGEDNTEFYYKGFDDLLPHKQQLWIDKSDKHDYSHWNLDADYNDLINHISAFDKTCYVSKDTGNAYGIKVDKNAKKYDDLHPSLFEFAGYMDAEDGDCTGEDETIKTIETGFKPAIMNDTNFEKEHGDSAIREQRFALFVDESMRPRRPDLEDLPNEEAQPGVKSYDDSNAVYSTDKLYALHGNKGTETKMVSDGIVTPGSFSIASDMSIDTTIPSVKFGSVKTPGGGSEPHTSFTLTNLHLKGQINEGYRLYLQDNFEPNDDGICPVEKHDWGLTLGIMRGSGSDAYVNYSGDPDDGEDNETWDIVPGSSATAHPDICDSYGKLWDYNGTQDGEGTTDGRFSLKLRAEKLNPNYVKGSTEAGKSNQYLPITNEALRGRGLMDVFYKEYSYWIRNARIIKRQVDMTLAQFLAIDKTKRVEIGDITGFITKMEFSVSNKSGLGLVTLTLMYI